jgi:hypothetical protein
VLVDGLLNEVMVQRFKEGLDIEVNDPVGTPAALSRRPDRIVRGLPRTIPV